MQLRIYDIMIKNKMNNNFKKIIAVAVFVVFVLMMIVLLNNKQNKSSFATEGIIANIPSVKTKEPIDISAWNDYINNQLGFSIKIPQEVPTLYRCPDNSQVGNTPLETYEDNLKGIVYISAQYYYDADWSQPEQRFIGRCDKITYSLETLENGTNNDGLYIVSRQKPFLGWKILITNIENEEDITRYFKDNFGSGCIAKDKVAWNQEGVYDVRIYGEDWDKKGTNLGNTTCPINFQYKVLYYPEKHKLMSVVTGQECTFFSGQCYDEEMLKSFKFIK